MENNDGDFLCPNCNKGHSTREQAEQCCEGSVEVLGFDTRVHCITYFMFVISGINSPVFMAYSAYQNKRAVNAQQCENGSNQQKGISFPMAENSIPQFSFLGQVTELAPTISQIINSKSGRITAAVTSHDVVNGYGRGFTFYLKLELLVEQCLSCFETQFSQPTFDCRWHRFEKRFMQVADAEAPTLEKALRKLEIAIQIRERMVA